MTTGFTPTLSPLSVTRYGGVGGMAYMIGGIGETRITRGITPGIGMVGGIGLGDIITTGMAVGMAVDGPASSL